MRQLIAASMIALFGMVGVASLNASPVYAADCNNKSDAAYNTPKCAVERGVNATGANDDANKTCVGDGGGKRVCTLGDRVQQVINVLLFLIGAISVIMIVIGGIKYTLSNGDSSQITSAKNTILYAVIGLVVALLAYAIVNFVVVQFT